MVRIKLATLVIVVHYLLVLSLFVIVWPWNANDKHKDNIRSMCTPPLYFLKSLMLDWSVMRFQQSFDSRNQKYIIYRVFPGKKKIFLSHRKKPMSRLPIFPKNI